jgi:hypothetical protein
VAGRAGTLRRTSAKGIDTLMIYAHEVDRERDPAEAYVDYGE